MPPMLESIEIRAFVSCSGCRDQVPLQGIVTAASCPSCGEALPPGERLWPALIDRERLAEVLASPWGRGDDVTSFGGTQSSSKCVHQKPRCRGCKTEFDPQALLRAADDDQVHCPACGEGISMRRADDLTRAVMPGAVLVLGETLVPTGHAKATQPVAFACMNCGGGLTVDGSSRAVTCSYCNTSNYLPDGLWLQLHPKPKAARITIVAEMQAQQRNAILVASDDALEAAAARPGLDPNLYFQAARSHDEDVRAAAARNPAVPPEILDALASDSDEDVRAAAAGNPSLAPGSLQRLASDPDADVRCATVSNANVSREIIAQLSKDSSARVKMAAQRHPFYEPPSAALGCLGRMIKVGFVLALILGAIGAFAYFLPRMGSPYEGVFIATNSCDEATDALGDPITQSILGFPNGETSTGGSSGSASWAIPVEGPKGTGRLQYSASMSGGTWSISSLKLAIDGRTIDVIECNRPPDAGAANSEDSSRFLNLPRIWSAGQTSGG